MYKVLFLFTINFLFGNNFRFPEKWQRQCGLSPYAPHPLLQLLTSQVPRVRLSQPRNQPHCFTMDKTPYFVQISPVPPTSIFCPRLAPIQETTAHAATSSPESPLGRDSFCPPLCFRGLDGLGEGRSGILKDVLNSSLSPAVLLVRLGPGGLGEGDHRVKCPPTCILARGAWDPPW